MTVNDIVNEIMTIKHSNTPKRVREFEIAKVLVIRESIDVVTAVCLAEYIASLKANTADSMFEHIYGIIIGYRYAIINRSE